MPSVISAKDLGQLALADFCPHCFWVRRKAAPLPFQIFPGIFSSIDAYSKRVVHGWFDRTSEMPNWLSGLGDLTSYVDPPHWSKFAIDDPDSGVTLRGSPDAIFTRPDGSYLIADYKTAKFTPTQDELLPLYEVQLNAYALIGMSHGLAPVSALALIYTEPLTDSEAATSDANLRADGFAMHFTANIHEVSLALDSISPLLAIVREIDERSTPPDGRPGCKNCEKLERLVLTANA